MNLLPSERQEYVENKQEYLSIWALAHAWEGLSPELTDKDDIPFRIKTHMDSIMLAFIREELPLRGINGLQVFGHRFWHICLGLDRDFDKIMETIRRKRKLDVDFLDHLFVRRSDLLHWCIHEFRQPPACWAPVEINTVPSSPEDTDEDSSWIDRLSQERKQKVACLEVARHLWKLNPDADYGDVYHHQLLRDTGLSSVFSFKSFKNWAAPYASKSAKNPGRRGESNT